MKRKLISDDCPLDDYVLHFIEGFSEPSRLTFGSWRDHVMSWLGTREERRDFVLIRYEDMLEKAERELAKVAPLLNIDVTPDRLKRAVELSSADRMRSLEKEQSLQWRVAKETRRDIPFVRTATSGRWKTVLSEGSVTAIERAWGPVMQRLGYGLSMDAGRTATLQVERRG